MRNAVAGTRLDPRGGTVKAFKEVVSLGSRYGIVGLLLRTAQVTALIFWISLLGCAEKGWAGIAIVLSVVVVLGMGAESATRSRGNIEDRNVWAALALCAAHLGLVGGMAAVFFGDEQAEGWVGAAVLLGGMLICDIGGVLDMDRPIASSPPGDRAGLQVISGQKSHRAASHAVAASATSSRAVTSPITISAGLTTCSFSTRSGSPASRPRSTRISGRVPFSMTATGMSGESPSSISFSAISGAVFTPI